MMLRPLTRMRLQRLERSQTQVRCKSKSPAPTNSTVTGRHVEAQSALVTGQRFRTLKRGWNTYVYYLEKHPILTKIASGSVIAGAGDVGCQLFVEQGENSHGPFNKHRAAVFTFVGGVVIPPILHGWYGFLNTRFPGTRMGNVVKRLATDQLAYAPLSLPFFFGMIMLFEGKIYELPAKLESDWWPAIKTNWAVWVPAQLFNFRFVPAPLQVLFSNVVGLFWNSYLSYVSHAQQEEEEMTQYAEEDHQERLTSSNANVIAASAKD